MTKPSAQRDENRFTDDDRKAIRARVTEVALTFRGTRDPDQAWALRRVGAAAIGCSLHDLRSSELAEVDALVAEVLA